MYCCAQAAKCPQALERSIHKERLEVVLQRRPTIQADSKRVITVNIASAVISQEPPYFLSQEIISPLRLKRFFQHSTSVPIRSILW